jgi:hypothetical protein
MASLIESPEVAFVPESSKLPASSPFWLSRLILPFIGIAIGVSVGSAAGLTLSLVNAPSETVAAASDATQASPASTQTVATLAVNGHLSSAHPVAKAHALTAVQIARNKTPDAVKPAMFRLGGKEWRVARPIAIPVSQPVRQGLASAPAAAPNSMPAPHA